MRDTNQVQLHTEECEECGRNELVDVQKVQDTHTL
jgi:hypothetical protein